MVSFERQSKMSEPILKQNWKVYLKVKLNAASNCWKGSRLIFRRLEQTSVPRAQASGAASCGYCLWWH